MQMTGASVTVKLPGGVIPATIINSGTTTATQAIIMTVTDIDLSLQQCHYICYRLYIALPIYVLKYIIVSSGEVLLSLFVKLYLAFVYFVFNLFNFRKFL